MKVLIVSDSHGNLGVLKRLVERERPFDLMVHLGDGIAEALRVQSLLGFNLDGVEGNNDLKQVFPTTLTLRLGKVNCFFTHGHLFSVSRDLTPLIIEARKSQANLVFFGHTHRYFDESQKGMRLLNPGSVCNYLTPEPAYLILQIEGKQLMVEKRLVSNEKTC